MQRIAELEPTCVWQEFEKICAIPRPSKHEERIVQYLLDFANTHNLVARKDEVGNVFISKPATTGCEGKEIVVLQSHVDMVPQKEPSSNHNFTTDAIEAFIDNDVVRAKGTTLGADNGIGVAMILAVLSSTTIQHGPIEALFTIDEETGMTGAFALKSTDIQAKYLINLDTENENEIIIGCAGGLDLNVSFDLDYSKLEANTKVYTISLSGLVGGHSGFEINFNRANANKVMSEFLLAIMEKTNLRLVSFNGGNMRNAIPREATAVVAFNKFFENQFHRMFEAFVTEKQMQFEKTDSDFSCIAAETIAETYAISQETTAGIVRALAYCPNGVVRYENHDCQMLNTSTNLAIALTNGNKFTVGCLLRSIDYEHKMQLANTMKVIFELYGGTVEFCGEYPGWQPVWESKLLSVVKRSHADMFDNQASVDIVHAGLECGIFVKKFPEMEAVSFGPTICGPHSPNEFVEIQSVAKIWEMLKDVLKNIPEK